MDELSDVDPVRVVVFDADEDAARTLSSELSHYGLLSEWHTDIKLDIPDDAIVFASIETRKKIERRDLRWIALESTGTLEQRLEAVHYGAMGFALKPVSLLHVIDLIQDMQTQPTHADRGRVLVVDDQQDMLDMLQSLLHSVQLQTVAISDPNEFFLTVSEFQPDVIVMDFYLPETNGLELAGALRHWEQTHPVPIVFLTGETRAEIEHTVLSTGMDHFLTKPLDRDRFLAVIEGLIRRSRKLQNLADVDALTRLLNRRRFSERLDQEIERSRREFRPLAYAILDLDNFKAINDQNGHLVGDEVLRQFALLMRNQMRQGDILGRVGGEEFAIVLPNATSKHAEIAMERLRETADQVLFGQPPNIEMTFSYGVSMWSESSTAKSLYARADGELYRAKRAGKNRGFISETEDSFSDTTS